MIGNLICLGWEEFFSLPPTFNKPSTSLNGLSLANHFVLTIFSERYFCCAILIKICPASSISSTCSLVVLVFNCFQHILVNLRTRAIMRFILFQSDTLSSRVSRTVLFDIAIVFTRWVSLISGSVSVVITCSG